MKAQTGEGGNILAALSVIFGAMHVVGWNFEFPTEVEKILWRVASICCGAVPALCVPFLKFFFRFEDRKWFETAFFYVSLLIYIVYSVLRLYLFIEMFIGLRVAPPGIYQMVQWSQYFPSFG